MDESILSSTKKALNLTPEYTAFDPEIIMHINSVFATLNDLGIGPVSGYEIEDETAVWSTYLEGNLLLNRVKTYMYLRVRMLFDPPTTSYLLSAMNDQIQQMEWRINAVREKEEWVNPNVDVEI